MSDKFYYSDMFYQNSPEDLLHKIENGLDLQRKDVLDKTFFEYAVQYGTPEMVRACIDRGVDVDCFDRGKKKSDPDNSPLAAAIGEFRPEIVRMLLDAGAPVGVVEDMRFEVRENFFPEALQSDNEGVREYARDLDDATEILDILRDAGAQVPAGAGERGKATYRGVWLGVPLEYDENFAMEWQDIAHLWSAVSPEALRLRIADGADVNARNAEGWTAVHYIVQHGGFESNEMVRVLAAAGADVDAGGVME